MLKIVFLIFIQATVIFCSPAHYTILRLPQDTKLIIDGNIQEWPEAYLIDSLRSINNYYPCVNDSIANQPFSRDRYQCYVYAAHDNDKVYWALKVMADNLLITGGCTMGCDTIFDCMYMDLGLPGTKINIWSNSTIRTMVSSPFVVGDSLNGHCNSTGNGGYPTYEVSIKKNFFNVRGQTNNWHIITGSDENGRFMCGIGSDFGITNKSYCPSTLIDTASFPTWHASDTLIGPPFPVAIEEHSQYSPKVALFCTPNPFNCTVNINYNTKPENHSKLSIFTADGQQILTMPVNGHGTFHWQAMGLNNGLFICRLNYGDQVLSAKLLLIR